MVDFSQEFTHLDKCGKDYSENVDRSCQIDQICNNLCNQISQGYNTDVKGQENLQKFVQSNVSQIKSNIDNNFKEVMQIII